MPNLAIVGEPPVHDRWTAQIEEVAKIEFG
jgi:hypothetical protein